MSGRPSQWLSLNSSTTVPTRWSGTQRCGDRRREPERERSARSTTPYGDRRDLSRGCGRLRFRSRERRRVSSGTRGLAMSWFSTPSCRRWRNCWWKSFHPRPRCFKLPSPAVKYFAPPPVVQASSPVVEYVAPAPAVVHSPTPVVEYIVSAPAVIPSPAPVVESIAPALVVQAPAPVVESVAPALVVQAPAPVVKDVAPAPAVLQAPTPVHCTRACSCPSAIASGEVSCSRAGLVRSASARWVFCHLRQLCFVLVEVFKALSQDRVPPLIVDMIFLSLLGGSVCYWHVHTRQTRWTPPVSEDEVENEEDEEDDEVEDEEDEDMDEIYRTESRFSRWVPTHADVPVVPLRELPAGVGVYVCSLGERAAHPSSWSRALTTSTGETGGLSTAPLYLAVTCSIRFLPGRIRRWAGSWKKFPRFSA